MDDSHLTGMDLLRSRRGALAKIARALGRSSTAPYQWAVVPTRYLKQIEAATGIPRKRLRPDLYD